MTYPTRAEKGSQPNRLEMDVSIVAAWEKNVPAAESPASRYNRTEAQMRGDWQLNNNNANNLLVDGKLTYDADGRYDRKFNHRGGEYYGKEDGTYGYEEDGRNSREYVDRASKISAVNGEVSRIWDSPASARD